jgi:NTP pyrophosphatase (non-canonical NTP hydrolase)
MNDALKDILEERERQDELWGEQNHHPVVWLSILMEEVGELAQEINEYKLFDNPNKSNFTFNTLRDEAIQVAAVAIAMVECLDRNKEEELGN